MATLLKTLQEQGIQDQKNKLYTVTKNYMVFMEMVSSTTKLQNTLQISIENYQERLEILKRNNDRVYNRHIQRFERSLNQIKHDLNYCQSTTSSVHTGLDLLRGANSIATQKSGVDIQAAMAVMEIVFVSYYSLGFWHLIVKEEVWEHISSFDRAFVGLGLAFFLTVGSHSYYVSKKRQKCFGYLVAALFILIYAYCVTCDINIFQS